MRNKTALLLMALLLDVGVGDPPNRWHPVAWMGTLIQRLRVAAPEWGKFVYGGGITLGGGLFVWLLTQAVVNICRRLPPPLDWLAQVVLLKTTISLRGLDRAAAEVEAALRAGDLPEARRLLSWHLVSRDTAQLSEAQVAAAAIESVAENTSDGILAPLFWYGVAGLPGALTYRYLQTCDSILGYHDVEREWLGKIPARTDDLLNLIPARLTALLLVMLRPSAWAVWRRDARLTASPNAGHPMSAMAGALGVELEKVGHYRLNRSTRPPTGADLHRSRILMRTAVGLFALLSVILGNRRDD